VDSASHIRKKTISGFKWNLFGQILAYAVSMASTIILSRLLDPQHFGLLGMLTVLTSLGSLFVGMGLSHAVVHNQDLDDEDLSTIFWLNFALGTCVGVFFFLAAGFIADFYEQPGLFLMTRWFSLIFLIYGGSAVSIGLLSKRMDFKSLILSQLIGNTVSTVIAISMAWYGFAVWALIAQAFSNQLIYVLLNFYYSKWHPRVVFKKSSLRKIFKFSRNLLPNQLIDFFAFNIDMMVIGKVFGTRELGLYSRAGALVMLPVNSLGMIYNKTFFSTFAALQQDQGELQINYFRGIKLLLLTLMPILIIVAICSGDIVLILFGEKWLEISMLVSVLSISAAVTAVNNFNDSFIISQGRTDLLLRVNTIEKAILIVAIFIGSRYGLMGIAFAKVVAVVITFVPRILLLSRIVGLSAKKWLKSQLFVLILLLSGSVAGYLMNITTDALPAWVSLAFVIMAVTGSILVLLVLMRDQLFFQLLTYLKTWLHSKTGAPILRK
jgi:O-antigen/teichoic acid export membrane protein